MLEDSEGEKVYFRILKNIELEMETQDERDCFVTSFLAKTGRDARPPAAGLKLGGNQNNAVRWEHLTARRHAEAVNSERAR